MKTFQPISILSSVIFLLFFYAARSQQITGIWKGYIKSAKIELKLVKKGDTLFGTSYYYDSKNNYRRYSIKGYFDDETNNVVWWDELLIEDKSSMKNHTANPQYGLLAIANFNCPGEGIMKLEGNISARDDKNLASGPIYLIKSQTSVFSDEWDFVLDNYTIGANDPYIIDSINRLAWSPLTSQQTIKEEIPLAVSNLRPPGKIPEVGVAPLAPKAQTDKAMPLTVEGKFTTRTKMLQQVITIAGDSIELSFYDNAEIDGDSIALFLNGKRIFQHVMLTDRPFTVKFASSDLNDDNECVMVAENLGSIPPNTALMIVRMGDKRYEAHLYSTENSSALIRFIKTAAKKKSLER